jgi:hypothetical protein
LAGRRSPYLWTGEWHKHGLRLHAHFAVGRYVPQTKIEGAWPHGFVHIKLLGDLPYGSVALDQARLAARYLSKYVGKSFAEQGQGLHILVQASSVSLENVRTALRPGPKRRSYRGNATVARMNTKYTAVAAMTRMWNTS